MFIMDDLGYGDVGSYGAPDVKTPNIDRLAREGVKLTDFYANHANCSPTRTGFITGRYQQRYGIESPLTALENETRHLPPSDTSLPRLLKNAGYATGLFGKWHLGARAESGPNRHGFDEFWGFRFGAVDYYTHHVSTSPTVKLPAPIHDLYLNEQPTTSTSYLTDEITERAAAFIEQRAGAPFFVEVAYNATHWPFQRPELPEGKRGYANTIESGTRADYVAMLERADQGIGRILGVLDRLKLAPNTLVIFTSDNGGEWLSRNAPLFHRKSTLWEGGIRVPLLMRWPGRLKAGLTSRQVGITMDLTASILAAAGVTPPASYRPEGIDLIGSLQKGAIVERTLFWRLPGPPVTPGPPQQRAVRRGNWKYLQDRGQNFLYDLGTDPGEQRDLAQSHIALWQELRALADKWEADVNAEAKQRATPTSTSASAQTTADKSDVIVTTSIHSSLQLELGGKVIQVDPWSRGDLSKLKPADLILITDDVNHHLDLKAIAKLRKPGAPVVIAANGLKQVPDGIVMANGDARDVAGFRIEATAAYDVTPGVSFDDERCAGLRRGEKTHLHRGRHRVRAGDSRRHSDRHRLLPDESARRADGTGGGDRVHQGLQAEGGLSVSLRSGLGDARQPRRTTRHGHHPRSAGTEGRAHAGGHRSAPGGVVSGKSRRDSRDRRGVGRLCPAHQRRGLRRRAALLR
jgi:arylsulfatase A-like enzyme